MQAPNFGGCADRGASSYRPVAQIDLASVPSGLTIVHKDDREVPDRQPTAHGTCARRRLPAWRWPPELVKLPGTGASRRKDMTA